jgi:hypothetical protein
MSTFNSIRAIAQLSMRGSPCRTDLALMAAAVAMLMQSCGGAALFPLHCAALEQLFLSSTQEDAPIGPCSGSWRQSLPAGKAYAHRSGPSAVTDSKAAESSPTSWSTAARSLSLGHLLCDCLACDSSGNA